MNKPKIEKSTIHGIVCAISAFTLLLLMESITGRIPVNDGAGWDGQVYLSYIEALGNGIITTDSPYYLSRLPGYFPAILAAMSGIQGQALLQFQAGFNILILAVSLGILLSTILSWGVKSPEAWLSIACLGLSWPWLVMPVFYPMLSDHAALVLATLSIYAWSKGNTKSLVALAFVSVGVMPGLFLVPVLLASIPESNQNKNSPRRPLQQTVRRILKLTTAVGMSILFAIAMRLPNNEIASHPQDIGLGIISLKPYSIAYLLAALLITWYAWAKVIDQPKFWQCVSFKGLLSSLTAVALGFTLLFLIANFQNGISGPPLIKNMLLQTLAAPAKPISAQFLLFGPTVPLALYTAILWIGGSKNHDATKSLGLVTVILAYLPFLLLGTESRQWIGVFPVCVAWLVTHQSKLRFWIILVTSTIILLLPTALLQKNIQSAIDNTHAFSHWTWQFYFSRQGPWMSKDVYALSIPIMIGLIAALIIASKFKNSKPETKANLQ